MSVVLYSRLHRLSGLAGLFLFLWTCTASGAEEIMVRARVFTLSPAAADALMGEPDFQKDIRVSIAKIQEMVTRNQASVTANPSIQMKEGARASSTGLVKLIAEVHKQSGQSGYYDVNARVEYGEQALTAFKMMKRGEVVFMGSFDPKDAKTAAGTCLVFLVVQ